MVCHECLAVVSNHHNNLIITPDEKVMSIMVRKESREPIVTKKTIKVRCEAITH